MSADDIEAINTYFSSTAIKTPEAGNLQAQWKTWYGNLNFLDKMTDGTFQEASNRRTVFNAANQNPEDLTHAADLTPARASAKQAAIASSPALSPAQKAVAIAKNPTIPTTPSVPGSATSHATIKQGSKGSDVAAWQKIIGVTADGNFGSGTATATKAFQTKHGLTADGVVGPKTWSAALGTPVQEAPSGGISSGPSLPFAATISSAPFQPVSPSPAAHAAAVKAGTTPVATAAATANIVAAPVAHTILKVALPAAGLAAGAFFFGGIGAIVGGAIGLFGSSKV